MSRPVTLRVTPVTICSDRPWSTGNTPGNAGNSPGNNSRPRACVINHVGGNPEGGPLLMTCARSISHSLILYLEGPVCCAAQPGCARVPAMKAPVHYSGSYRTRAKAIVLAAVLNPLTRCWRCGLTMNEIKALHPGRRITWQAGHTKDRDSSRPILAEHSYCNERHGQAAGESQKMNHSKRWANVG